MKIGWAVRRQVRTAFGKNYEESGAEVVDETDILYDPFDLPPGEVVIQVWPRSQEPKEVSSETALDCSGFCISVFGHLVPDGSHGVRSS